MPIILAIIFAVMAAAFYFHDLVVSQAILDKNTARLENILVHPFGSGTYYYDYSAVNKRFLSSFSQDDSGQEEIYAEQIEKELKRSLMILNMQNPDVQIESKKITVSVKLCYALPLLGVRYLPFFGKTKEIRTCRFIYDPASFARLLARAGKKAAEE